MGDLIFSTSDRALDAVVARASVDPRLQGVDLDLLREIFAARFDGDRIEPLDLTADQRAALREHLDAVLDDLHGLFGRNLPEATP